MTIAPFDNFRQLSMLLLVIERVAASPRVRSLTLHRADGQVVGKVTLDAALVRIGVEVEGVAYIDAIFYREASPVGALLARLMAGEELSTAENQRIHNVLLVARRALCSLTARALRRMAPLCDLSKIRIAEREPSAEKESIRERFSFSTVELLLSAGRLNSVRYTDGAARIYETPPEPQEERWLFEWQSEDPGGPWPIMTTRLAERKTNTVAQFGLLGQSLARRLAGRSGESPHGLAAGVFATDVHAYYAVSTQRYLTLLVYQIAHVDKAYKSLNAIIFDDEATQWLAAVDTRRLTEEAEAKRLAAEAHAKRVAEQAEAKRSADAAEAKRLADEAEAKRSAEAAEAKRLADEAEAKRIAEEAHAKRVTEEAAAKQAIEQAAVADRAAEEAAARRSAEQAAEERLSETAAATAIVTEQESILLFQQFAARTDERTHLQDIDLKIARRGVHALIGPAGSGKSALLGVLSGRHRAATGWAFSGEIRYQGATLGSGARPAVLQQKMAQPAVSLRHYLLDDASAQNAGDSVSKRLVALLESVGLAPQIRHLDAILGGPAMRLSIADWWLLAIARELWADPPLLCIDEPTTNLDDADAARILSVLQQEGKKRALLIVTHNQQHARACSDWIILLASGRVQEHQPTRRFFEEPQSEAAQLYVRTDACPIASPEPALPPAVLPAPGALWACTSPLLRLRDFGLTIAGRPFLSDLALDIAPLGLHLLACGEGVERRLLLRVLCGPRASNFQFTGQALYQGRALIDSTDDGPSTPPADARLVMKSAHDYLLSGLPNPQGLPQSAQRTQITHLIEQSGFPELICRLEVALCDLERHERRVVEILRCVAADPRLLVLDDPAARLSNQEEATLMRLIEQEATQRAVLILAADPTPYLARSSAPPVGVAWLSGGRLYAAAPQDP